MAEIIDQTRERSQCIVVVPCYNEERRLRADEFLAFVNDFPDFRFFFVNDGSTDGTTNVLREVKAAATTKIDILELESNCGKAEAVRRGLLAAVREAPDFVGYWDADLSTPLEEALPIVQLLKDRPDVEVVIGARVRLLGRRISRRPVRHYLGRLFATLASVALRLPIYDTQCGAKIFKVTPGLSRVLELPFSSRWIFDVELLDRFLRMTEAGRFSEANRRIVEYPLMTWHDVAGSKLRAIDGIRALWDLTRIAWKRRFGPRMVPTSASSPARVPQR